MNTNHLSEQEIIRREKRAELEKLGIDPYPAALYPVNTTAAYIREHYKGEENKADFADVCIAGRIRVRDMGKANFACCRMVQVRCSFTSSRMISVQEDKSLYQQVWKKLVDIGDFVGKGYVFTTKTGEVSVHIKEFTILSKSLRPLPIVKEKDGEAFDEVTNPEFRYRQRYTDLIVNPGVKEVFVKELSLSTLFVNFSMKEEHWKLIRLCCRASRAVLLQGLSLHTTMRWMCLCTCIANELYLKDSLLVALNGYTSSAGISGMKEWTVHTIPNSRYLNFMWPTKIMNG
jgi:lysyl-tRNA synthetase class 2